MPVNQLELWRALGRIEAERDATNSRLDRIEGQVSEIKNQLGTLTTWGQRGGLLILLWVAAIGINLNAEQKAEAVGLILKHLAR